MNASTRLGSFLDQRRIQYTTKWACSTSACEDHDIQSRSGAELRLFLVGIIPLVVRGRVIDECFRSPGDAQFLRMSGEHSIQKMANDQATDKATTKGKQCAFKNRDEHIACRHAREKGDQESGQAGNGRDQQGKPSGSHHSRNRPDG